MKLTIFGSTGSIGKLVTQQAIELGHSVTAFARSPSKITLSHPNLTSFQGDIHDLGAVEQACEGQDAVICTLGMPLFDKSMLRSKGTKNIVQAMSSTGVDRLICLSSMGVGDSAQLLPVKYKYIIGPLFMRRLFADHSEQERVINGSSLNWTIVRPGNFVKSSQASAYRHGFRATDPPSKAQIARADVAEFMTRQLSDDTYWRQSPSLSY